MKISYIPNSLDDFVGLDSLKKSLYNFEYDSPLIFVGEKGCGKSALSMVIARSFGAKLENIRIINCGYYTKIDDMRYEIDILNKSSLFGNKKVLILDEVHRLSVNSQDAWLLPLQPENLSPNVLILACTTTVSKLAETFLRRFVFYRVNKLTNLESKKFINIVCENNNITLPKFIRDIIVEKCDGIPGIMLNGIKKLVNIETVEEAQYLLELNRVDDDKNLFNFVKLLLKTNDWGVIRNKLDILLKDKPPDDIRCGVVNLISGRLVSSYFSNPNEGDLLIKLYDNLRNSTGYLEKADLIFALYKYVRWQNGRK